MTYPPIPYAFEKTAAPMPGQFTGLMRWLMARKMIHEGGRMGSSPMEIPRRLLRMLVRQTHGLTGHLPVPGFTKLDPVRQRTLMTRLGLGEPAATKQLSVLRRELPRVQAQVRSGALPQPKLQKLEREIQRAQAGQEWNKLTGGTIPGTVQALTSGSAKDVLRTGWQQTGPFGKALMVGLGGKGLYDVANTPEEAYGQPGMPRSRMSHLGRELGGDLAWLATGGMPAVPMMLGYEGAARLGEMPGNILYSARQRRQQRQGLQPPPDSALYPAEYYGE